MPPSIEVMPQFTGAASIREGAQPLPAAPCDFRAIFRENAPFVWRSLMALGVAESDVPDASQQVFVVLNQKLGQLDPDCSIRTFAYGICLRVASDFRNRAHMRREHLCAELPERSAHATPEGIHSQREALWKLRAALDDIPAPQRDVFVLYEIEELDMAEVARAVGCPLQTAYSRLHAARKVVVAALGEHLQDIRMRVPGRSP